MPNTGKALFILRFLVIIILWILFLIFFGVPSLERFLKKETIFVETTRKYRKEDLPVLSVSKFKNGMLIDDEIDNKCFSLLKYEESIRL